MENKIDEKDVKHELESILAYAVELAYRAQLISNTYNFDKISEEDFEKIKQVARITNEAWCNTQDFIG